jgi:predicted amidohydrolase
MLTLTIAARTADVGTHFENAEAFISWMIERTLQSWQEGADVVLWPEFAWLALEKFSPGLEAVARVVWQDQFEMLRAALSVPGKCVVLGTAPASEKDALRNRCLIFSDGQFHYQDKLCLTPWEAQFERGQGIHTWMLGGWKLAVLVCLDVEIPEHSVALRGQNVDVLLIPSATETLLGTERIARCASARSVELGCHVVVSHLVGKSDASSLIDENMGRLSCYSPSQAAFKKAGRIQETEVFTDGWNCLQFQLERQPLERMRRNKVETNPAKVRL